MVGFVALAHWFGLIWYILFKDAITRGVPRVEDVSIPQRYTCCLYWAFGVMTQLQDDGFECVRNVIDENEKSEQVRYMLVVFVTGVVASSTIFGALAELVANIGQASQRYRKQIDVLNELFSFYKLPQKLYSKVRDHVDTEFALTKGIDVASACSGLPPRLQIEIFFHLNRKLVMQVPLFTRLPSDWIDAMVMQMKFSFYVSGSVVIEEEAVSDSCYFVKRGILQSVHDDMVMRTYTEGTYFGDVRALFSGPSLVEVRAVTDSMLLTLSSSAVDLVNAAFPEVRVIFRQIRRLRQKLFRKNPIAASGLESVEVILRSREAQAETQQGAVRPNTVRNFMSTRGARPSRFSRADSRSLDKAKLKRMSSLLSFAGANSSGAQGQSSRAGTSRHVSGRGSDVSASMRSGCTDFTNPSPTAKSPLRSSRRYANDCHLSSRSLRASDRSMLTSGRSGRSLGTDTDTVASKYEVLMSRNQLDDAHEAAADDGALLASAEEHSFIGRLQNDMIAAMNEGSFSAGILDGAFDSPGTSTGGTPSVLRNAMLSRHTRVAPDTEQHGLEVQVGSPFHAVIDGTNRQVIGMGSPRSDEGEAPTPAKRQSAAARAQPCSVRAMGAWMAGASAPAPAPGRLSPPPSPPSEAACAASVEESQVLQLLRGMKAEINMLREDVAAHSTALQSIGRDVKKALASQSASGVDSTMIRLFPFSFHDEAQHRTPREERSSRSASPSWSSRRSSHNASHSRLAAGLATNQEVLGTWNDLARGAGRRPTARQFSDDELRRVFESIDTDKSGEIDRPELMAALKQINPHADDATVENMLTFADSDGDVRVSFDEFKELIRGGALQAKEEPPQPQPQPQPQPDGSSPMSLAKQRWRTNCLAVQTANRLSKAALGPKGQRRQRALSRDTNLSVASSASAVADSTAPSSRAWADRVEAEGEESESEGVAAAPDAAAPAAD